MAKTTTSLALLATVLAGLAAPQGLRAGGLDGLEARYEFEEPSGQTVLDSSANNLHGVLGQTSAVEPDIDPTRVSSGLFGQALHFVRPPGEADHDVVTLPPSEQFITGTTEPFTFSGWVNPDSFDATGVSASNRIFTLYQMDGFSAFALGLGESLDGGETGKVGAIFRGGAAFSGDSAFSSADGWHHVALTHDGTTATVYLDGTPDGSLVTPHVPPGAYAASIGAFQWSGSRKAGFDGLIDDASVWSRALSGRELAAIAGLGDFARVDLASEEINHVLALDSVGQWATAGGIGWQYTETFPAAEDGSALEAGLHYIGVDGRKYIILDGSPESGVRSMYDIPEPATLSLAAAALAGLGAYVRRRKA